MLSVLSKLKSILWDLKIEGEVRILLKKDTKQYRKRSLYTFSSASIIFKNVCFPINVPRMTERDSLFLYLRVQQLFWYSGTMIWYTVHCKLYDFQYRIRQKTVAWFLLPSKWWWGRGYFFRENILKKRLIFYECSMGGLRLFYGEGGSRYGHFYLKMKLVDFFLSFFFFFFFFFFC